MANNNFYFRYLYGKKFNVKHLCFYFPNLWNSCIGDHVEEGLAKFGYKSKGKHKKTLRFFL
jgi:hypothetical protein